MLQLLLVYFSALCLCLFSGVCVTVYIFNPAYYHGHTLLWKEWCFCHSLLNRKVLLTFFKLLRVHKVQLQIQRYQNVNDVFEEVGRRNTSLLFQVTQPAKTVFSFFCWEMVGPFSWHLTKDELFVFERTFQLRTS